MMRENQVSLLVLKCEVEDRVKSAAIAEFLELDEFQMVRSNVSDNKPYADQYAEFKRRIHVPPALLDRMYESKYARHFYTEEERASFRAQWS